jgi:transcriptional regulator with XRE-family HTH domain
MVAVIETCSYGHSGACRYITSSHPHKLTTFQGRVRPMPHRTQWREYVRQVVGDDRNADISRKTGIDQGTISRWLKEDKEPPATTPPRVRAFALGYGRPVLEAFTRAGILHEEETGISAEPQRVDWAMVSDAELLAEVRERLDRRHSRG